MTSTFDTGPKPQEPPSAADSAEAPATAAAAAPAARRGSIAAGLRPLLLRMHFYAGILIAPFLFAAAATGLLYAAATPLEKFVYEHELTVDRVGTQPLPVAQQVRAATAANPGGTLSAVRLSDDPEATTQVLFTEPGLDEGVRRAVFVDPYTGEIRGIEKSFGGSGALPLRAWLDQFHANLKLGEPGRLYSELAASWLWVIVLGGLALWFGRRRRAKKDLVLPERGAKGRRRTLSWHGTVGLWASLGLLGLSATGLTWSTHAGANIADLRTSLSWTTPLVSTALPASGAPGSAAPAPAEGGEHSGHQQSATPGPAAPAGAGLDAIIGAAAGRGLDGPLEIVVPAKPGKAYVVKETDKQWPVRLDQVAVDPADAKVVDELRYADYPLGAKLTRVGIDLHMGEFLGLANQLALIALALMVLVSIVLGYRMWWQRRPVRGSSWAVGRPYPRGAWRQSAKPAAVLAVVAAAAGWFVPLLGITLAAFLAADILIGAIPRRRAA
ncbi:PepSY-associated TM helix domain-containing protein [Yinghuangia soli]|uniref:PepSY domain-containing protein n=1 Tax=Yinghuangia soli TaxID=2908204 RepID=A0AA41Q440_9ACTN|nr:PepSY domain-containing protein [Yinghuangia soli]MCF2530966.1 PepSY domain-containing protein [Yinghuangia soli]